MEKYCNRRLFLNSEIGLDDRRVFSDFFRPAASDYCAMIQDNHPFGNAHHHLHVVFNQEDRDLKFITYPTNQFHQVSGFRGIHSSSRLIQKQQFWTCRQRTGDFQAALIAVGESACECLGVFGQIEDIQDFQAVLEDSEFLFPMEPEPCNCGDWTVAGPCMLGHAHIV